MQRLCALARRRDGSVAVISALVLPLLIAIVGMVAEYGNGLLHKIEDQRIADAAAFAAATAYNSNSSNSLTSVVDEVATINGIATADISESVVSSPSGDGNQAVLVTVTTQTPLILSKVLNTTQASLTETATSYAEMKGGAPGCIIALNSAGTGVSANGGTSVTADSCAINSDASVTVSGGATITTPNVYYDTTAPSISGGASIVAPSGKTLSIAKAATADPLAGTSELATATGRLTSGTIYAPNGSTVLSSAGVESLSSPSGPSTTGWGAATSVNFAYSTPALPTGCSDSRSGGTHTVTCTGNGPFYFGNITTQGGTTVTVTATGSAPVFDINGYIKSTGTSMSWPAGTYNITGYVYTGGGNTLTFGQGTFNIGSGSTSCGSGYAICNTGTLLSFGGSTSASPGSIDMTTAGGIYNSGGETLTLGTGTTNSFGVGVAGNGDSFYQGGGGKTTFGDATGAGDSFVMAGNLDVGSGGGSCLTISAATEHDINGFFSSAGGTSMGSGTYTISDWFALGPNGGGDVTCNGTAIGMTGTNVSLVLGGASLPSSGNNSGDAFYMGAGYSNVTLLAPTTGALANLAVVGPTSGTAPAVLAEGASGADFSGAFYFPTAPVSLSGGSSLGSFGSSQCLMVIGSQVSLTGGTALASSCSGIGNATASKVVLVQ